MALAVAKSALWTKLRYEPHRAQVPIHASRARNRVNAAGRRTGKSTMGGHELVPEAVITRTLKSTLEDNGLRREFWIVGPEYTDAEKEFRVFYNDCKRLGLPFDRPGTYYNAKSGDLAVSLLEGKFIVQGKSAKYPDSLVGEGLCGVIMAEAAKMKEFIWTKHVRPMLADFRGWSLFNSTPEGRNWFYDLWNEGQDTTNPEWESWRHPSWMNPTVFPLGATPSGIAMLRQAMEPGGPGLTEQIKEDSGVDPEIISMLRDLTDELFNQEVAADFSEYVGRVFKYWDEETHVRDLHYDPNFQTFAATDYGWTNPTVWLLIQVDPFGTVYVLDELYERQKDMNEIATIIKARGLAPGGMTRFYPDPASPEDSHTLSKALRVPIGGGTGGPLNDRLNLIRQFLREAPAHLPSGHPEKKPRLLVNRRCKELIREMDAYRYPENRSEQKNDKEQPMDKDDHGPEALGRFFAGYFGPTQRRPRVSRARIG